MSTHVLQTKFWYFVVAIVAVGILALIAVEVAGRPREMKLRVAGMHCEGCVSNVTEASRRSKVCKMRGLSSMSRRLQQPTQQNQRRREEAWHSDAHRRRFAHAE